MCGAARINLVLCVDIRGHGMLSMERFVPNCAIFEDSGESSSIYLREDAKVDANHASLGRPETQVPAYIRCSL